MTFADGVTLGIALLGAVLGVMNTWLQLDTRRLRLEVTPSRAQIGTSATVTSLGSIPRSHFDQEKVVFSIKVTNLSAFAIEVTEVGLINRSLFGRFQGRFFIPPGYAHSDNLPKRLEPRSSLEIFWPARQAVVPRDVSHVYTRTSCGHIKFGRSPALKSYLAFLAEISP